MDLVLRCNSLIKVLKNDVGILDIAKEELLELCEASNNLYHGIQSEKDITELRKYLIVKLMQVRHDLDIIKFVLDS